MATGDFKIKSDHDHGRSNPHPVHGAPFAGKQAAPFKKKDGKMPMKKEDQAGRDQAAAPKEDRIG